MANTSSLGAYPLTTTRSRAWLIAALAFVLVRALPNIAYPIGRDQATYCLIGQGLLNGQQLYRDLWDNKPPGIFYLFAVIVKAVGPVMWCVGLVDILWLLAISYFLFRFTERYLGTGAAVIAVAFNASWHVWTGYWEAAQTETFLMLCVFASLFLIRPAGSWVNTRHFSAGLMFGAAFWLKYNAVAFLPFLLLVPYLNLSQLDRQPRRLGLLIPWYRWLMRTAIFMAGFALAVAVVLLQFWLADSWVALKQVQFEVLPRYSAIALERTPYYPLWALNQTEFILGFWTECALLAALVIAWRVRELARLAPILLGAAAGYVSVVLQVRFHAYAFETCYPFFAMAWGYLGVKIYEGFRAVAGSLAARGWRLARLLVWVLFANVVAWPLPDEVVSIAVHYQALREWRRKGDVFYAAYPWPNPISHFPDQMRVVWYLADVSLPGDGVFVWGSEPLIYFLTQRRPPTRFISNLALVSPWSPPVWREELVRDLEKSPPRFIVVARNDEVPYIAYTKWDSEEYLKVFPELAIFIFDRYEGARNFPNFVVYRRREPAPTGAALPSARHVRLPSDFPCF